MGEPAVVTVVTRNHLAAARALASSMREAAPGTAVHVCLADRPSRPLDPSAEPFRFFFADELGVPEWRRFCFQYTPYELCCALKPFALAHAFRVLGRERLLYLDSDVQVYHPLAGLGEALDSCSILLCPHLAEPKKGGEAFEAELTVRRGGVYNGGFLGLRKGPDTDTFLTWWAGKAGRHCIVDQAAGLFVDQSWLDLVPGLFAGVRVERRPGCNVAYWNLGERTVRRDAQRGWLANGEPLLFFHFSGFDPEHPARLSRYGGEALLDENPRVAELARSYAQRLKEGGHAECRAAGCQYDRLADGTPVSRAWREAVRVGHPLLADVRDPFDTRATPDLRARFEKAEAELGASREDWRRESLPEVLLWRSNYLRLARVFPVRAMLWLRRRLLGIPDPPAEKSR